MRWFFLTVIFLLMSCRADYNYTRSHTNYILDVNSVGKSYPKTDAVYVYLNKSEIKAPYDIIGNGTCESSKYYILAQDLQSSIEHIAKQKGAHGIILGKYNNFESNPRYISESVIDTLKNGNLRQRIVEKGRTVSYTKSLSATFI